MAFTAARRMFDLHKKLGLIEDGVHTAPPLVSLNLDPMEDLFIAINEKVEKIMAYVKSHEEEVNKRVDDIQHQNVQLKDQVKKLQREIKTKVEIDDLTLKLNKIETEMNEKIEPKADTEWVKHEVETKFGIDELEEWFSATDARWKKKVQALDNAMKQYEKKGLMKIGGKGFVSEEEATMTRKLVASHRDLRKLDGQVQRLSQNLIDARDGLNKLLPQLEDADEQHAWPMQWRLSDSIQRALYMQKKMQEVRNKQVLEENVGIGRILQDLEHMVNELEESAQKEIRLFNEFEISIQRKIQWKEKAQTDVELGILAPPPPPTVASRKKSLRNRFTRLVDESKVKNMVMEEIAPSEDRFGKLETAITILASTVVGIKSGEVSVDKEGQMKMMNELIATKTKVIESNLRSTQDSLASVEKFKADASLVEALNSQLETNIRTQVTEAVDNINKEIQAVRAMTLAANDDDEAADLEEKLHREELRRLEMEHASLTEIDKVSAAGSHARNESDALSAAESMAMMPVASGGAAGVGGNANAGGIQGTVTRVEFDAGMIAVDPAMMEKMSKNTDDIQTLFKQKADIDMIDELRTETLTYIKRLTGQLEEKANLAQFENFREEARGAVKELFYLLKRKADTVEIENLAKHVEIKANSRDIVEPLRISVNATDRVLEVSDDVIAKMEQIEHKIDAKIEKMDRDLRNTVSSMKDNPRGHHSTVSTGHDGGKHFELEGTKPRPYSQNDVKHPSPMWANGDLSRPSTKESNRPSTQQSVGRPRSQGGFSVASDSLGDLSYRPGGGYGKRVNKPSANLQSLSYKPVVPGEEDTGARPVYETNSGVLHPKEYKGRIAMSDPENEPPAPGHIPSVHVPKNVAQNHEHSSYTINREQVMHVMQTLGSADTSSTSSPSRPSTSQDSREPVLKHGISERPVTSESPTRRSQGNGKRFNDGGNPTFNDIAKHRQMANAKLPSIGSRKAPR